MKKNGPRPARPVSAEALRWRRAGWLAAFAFVAAAPFVLPYAPQDGLPCMFRYLSGVPCPGCGSTRAVRAMLSFDAAAALRLNPLVTVAIGVFVVRVLAWAGPDFGLWARPPRRKWPWKAMLPGLVVLLLINWVFLVWDGR